jgi:hypothetical protein
MFPASTFVVCITDSGHIAIEPAHAGSCENIKLKYLPVLHVPIHHLFNSVKHFHVHIPLTKKPFKFIVPGSDLPKYKIELSSKYFAGKAISLFSARELSHIYAIHNPVTPPSSVLPLNIVQTVVFLS